MMFKNINIQYIYEFLIFTFIYLNVFAPQYSLLDVERERSQLNSMSKMLDMKESILQSAILLPFNLVDIMEQHVPPKGSCITWKLLLR